MSPIMIATDSVSLSPKVILRGIHLRLTDAMKASLSEKAEKLLRHEPRILLVRIDVVREHTRIGRRFTARGHIEIAGPDLTASTFHEDGYLAINLLIDKLDRMLRKRATAHRRSRYKDDVRHHSLVGELV